MKLSGVKNTTAIERIDAHHVYCPQWGIRLETESEVPQDASAVGIRAFYLECVGGPGDHAPTPQDLATRVADLGENVFRVRVDRVTESRFEAAIMLSALDREEGAQPLVGAADQEMRFLHQRLFWRISTLYEGRDFIPEVGDEIFIHIPKEHIYVVTR